MQKTTGDSNIKIELSDKHDILKEKISREIYKILYEFAEKLSRHIKVSLVEATISAYHNKRGKITNFEFHLRVHLIKGKGYMTKVEDKKLMNVVHIAIDKIKHQANHSH